MIGESRFGFQRSTAAVGLAASILVLVSFVALDTTSAEAATTTDDASVVTVSEHSDSSCADYGVIRWKAVKGVDSYTVIFNDAAFGGAKQTEIVSEPFAGDNPEPAGGPLNAPGGTHQLPWTAGFYGPPCSEPGDYSQRLTNAKVKYVPKFGQIAGRVVDAEGHGVPDVRIGAKGKASLQATTDFDGDYRIEVPKSKLGSYDVAPNGEGRFDPKSKRVRVDVGTKAKANFTQGCSAAGGDGRFLPAAGLAPRRGKFRPLNGLYVYNGGNVFPLQPDFAVALYYQCTKKTLFANVSPSGPIAPPFTCTDGSTVAWVNYEIQVGPLKFDGEKSFRFNEDFNAGTQRVIVEGTFASNKAAEIDRVIVQDRGGGKSCRYESSYLFALFLADENPTPFSSPFVTP